MRKQDQVPVVVPKPSDTNWPVQSQKKAKILKFWIYVEEE